MKVISFTTLTVIYVINLYVDKNTDTMILNIIFVS